VSFALYHNVIDRYLYSTKYDTLQLTKVRIIFAFSCAVRRILFHKLFSRRRFRVHPTVWVEFLTRIFFHFPVLFTPTKLGERVYAYITYVYPILYIFFPTFMFTTESIHIRARKHKNHKGAASVMARKYD